VEDDARCIHHLQPVDAEQILRRNGICNVEVTEWIPVLLENARTDTDGMRSTPKTTSGRRPCDACRFASVTRPQASAADTTTSSGWGYYLIDVSARLPSKSTSSSLDSGLLEYQPP